MYRESINLSLLDLVLTNEENMITIVEPLGKSDHIVILFELLVSRFIFIHVVVKVIMIL